MSDNQELKAALKQFIQEHMPWPFYDVSRHDYEGSDTASNIADAVLPHLEREFSGIVRTATNTRRRNYPKASR